MVGRNASPTTLSKFHRSHFPLYDPFFLFSFETQLEKSLPPCKPLSQFYLIMAIKPKQQWGCPSTIAYPININTYPCLLFVDYPATCLIYSWSDLISRCFILILVMLEMLYRFSNFIFWRDIHGNSLMRKKVICIKFSITPLEIYRKCSVPTYWFPVFYSNLWSLSFSKPIQIISNSSWFTGCTPPHENNFVFI